MALTRRLLWTFILLGVLSSGGPIHALKISMYKNNYFATRGSDVKLACLYNHIPNTAQHMEIEWTVVPEDENIILFTAGRLYPAQYKPLAGRVSFTAADPRNGDASIIIRDVRQSDSKTYRCMVKKLPNLDRKNVELTVMEVPNLDRKNVELTAMEVPNLDRKNVEVPEGTNEKPLLWLQPVVLTLVGVTVLAVVTLAISIAIYRHQKKKSRDAGNQGQNAEKIWTGSQADPPHV